MARSNARLLVVQSDDQLASIISYRLQLLGYAVERSGAIAGAWNHATGFRPDGILLDLDGSRFEALDLIEQLSSDVDTAEIPVLAMSTDADLDLVEKVWRAGAVAFLVTPFCPEVLEQKVEAMLECSERESHSATESSTASTAERLVASA